MMVFPEIDDHPLKRTRFDNKIRVISLSTGQHRDLSSPQAGKVQGVAALRLSSDQKTALVVFDSSNDCQLWDVNDWRVFAVLTGHLDVVTDARYSHDQQRIVTASRDGTVKLWDSKSGSLLSTLRNVDAAHQPFWFASFGPDDRSIIAASPDGILTWTGETSTKSD